MSQELVPLMARLLQVEVTRLQPEVKLTDLVTESFVLIEFVISLQEELDLVLTHDDFNGVVTVGELLALVQDRLAQGAGA